MVATTEVRYENGKTDCEEGSDDETPERWVAHPGDIQRILSLQEELERVKECARKEQASERVGTPSTDNDGSVSGRRWQQGSRTPAGWNG